jgi:outer membrane lipoprotein carrier protein
MSGRADNRTIGPVDGRTGAPGRGPAGVPAHRRTTIAPRVALVAGLLAAIAVPPAARAQDAGAILDRAVAVYGRIGSFRADFVQEVSDPMIGDVEPTRGEILRQRPDRFAMRWTHPRGDLFVIDGQYQWIYLPSSTPNQVIRSRVTGRTGESADIFDQFLDKPHERFAVAYVRADRAGGREADVIVLTPRARDAAYARVQVWVDRQDSLVRKVEITEASGAVRRLTFDRLRTNVAIPASSFAFRPPTGIRVVDATP